MSSPVLSAGSGKAVADYNTLCEGDVEPSLNKRIRTLIDRNRDYIVYLDDDGQAEWVFNKATPDGFESIANKIADLETLSQTQLSRPQREPFARLVGEAMARILGDQNPDEAEGALAQAASYLNARGAENARKWYLEGAGIISLASLLISLSLLLLRSRITNPNWLDFLEITSGALIGAMGAFFSIASRTETVNLDPVAGSGIHRVEGMLRVAVGIVGALIVALAIKSDLLFGVFRSLPRPFTAMIVACLAAGASERLASGLIKNMEKSANAHLGK